MKKGVFKGWFLVVICVEVFREWLRVIGDGLGVIVEEWALFGMKGMKKIKCRTRLPAL